MEVGPSFGKSFSWRRRSADDIGPAPPNPSSALSNTGRTDAPTPSAISDSDPFSHSEGLREPEPLLSGKPCSPPSARAGKARPASTMPRDGSFGSLLLFKDKRRRRVGTTSSTASTPRGTGNAAASLGVFTHSRFLGAFTVVSSILSWSGESSNVPESPAASYRADAPSNHVAQSSSVSRRPIKRSSLNAGKQRRSSRRQREQQSHCRQHSASKTPVAIHCTPFVCPSSSRTSLA